MRTNPDAPRGPSIELTEDILKKLGLTCICLDAAAGQDDHTRLVLRTIVGRRAIGQKIWFRNQNEAGKVEKAMLSRCFEASRVRDGLLVKLPPADVADLVVLVARSLGITPIYDHDVATTFDSINRRIEATIAKMQRDGSMKRINREYAELRRSAGTPGGTSKGTKDGTTTGTLGTSLPSYAKWLVKRLGEEISTCTDIVHITRL